MHVFTAHVRQHDPRSRRIEEQMQYTGTANPCIGPIFSLSVMQHWNKMYGLRKFPEMPFPPREYRYFFSLYRYKMTNFFRPTGRLI